MNTGLAFSAPTYDHGHHQVLSAGKSALLRARVPPATWGPVLPRTPAPVPQAFSGLCSFPHILAQVPLGAFSMKHTRCQSGVAHPVCYLPHSDGLVS